MSTIKRISEKLKRLPKGHPFALETFKQCGSSTSVRQAISRLAKRGELVRLTKGVYARPKPMRHLRNPVLPTPVSVATVIAKQNREELAPHGADLARKLGLSTHVTMRSAFYTTGRTRMVPVGKGVIAFQHAPKYLIKQQHTPEGQALLALHHLGPRHVNGEVLGLVCDRIPCENFGRVNKDELPRWMRQAVKTLESTAHAG
ncbi:MAG TPA: DUF6088 family protein [Trueperaceae bacterium]|nr:DUF6088 family protein [Trueperaceae bacterium]